MCQEVFFNDGSADIGTIGELKAAYGAFVEGELKEYQPYSLEEVNSTDCDDDCLCGIDLKAFLIRVGDPFEFDPFGWRVLMRKSPDESFED